MADTAPPDHERVLVLAPTSSDAELTGAVLNEAGLASTACMDLGSLSMELSRGAGAILLTEEAIGPNEPRELVAAVRSQPPWSEIPILLLCRSGADSPAAVWAMESLGNVTVLERPARMTTLVSTLQTAIRARRRQYEIRDQLLALREAEATRELHAWIVESSNDAMISMTLDGVILSWNPGAERIFGYSASEAVGQSITLIVPPDKRKEELSILNRLRNGERVDHFDTVRVTKFGERLDISLTVSPLHDASGKIVGASKVGRDVTLRRHAAEAVRKRDERLRLLWEAAAVLLTTENPDAMMRSVFAKVAPRFGLDAYFNFMLTEEGDTPRLKTCVGIRRDQAEQIARRGLVHAAGAPAARDPRTLIASRVQTSEDPDLEPLRQLGVLAYACIPLTRSGRLLGMLSFVSRRRDVFEPDDLEFLETICHYVSVAYDRMRLIHELRDTDRRKDEFLATLAHELRNPLAPIRNGLEIMRLTANGQSSFDQARGMMERQLEQMVRLIDDLLDVSRITRRKMELRKERVDLASIVRNAIDATRPIIEASGHELTVEMPADPIVLDADPIRIAQVLSNLLNNAAKYTNRGGKIRLSAAREDRDVIVAVRDNGVGIPAESLKSIFELFTQVDRSLERSHGGLGIGLTLVKRLTEMHGGSVRAESAGVGQGSAFIVRLPSVPQMSAPTARSDEALSRSSTARFRILVADDNRDAADSLSMVLRLMGNEVRTVHDGLQAMIEAAEFRPDLALLDIGMPGMNGYDVARRIRAQRWGRNMVLVAITGWGQQEDRERAIEAGFDRHFTKPTAPAEVERLMGGLRDHAVASPARESSARTNGGAPDSGSGAPQLGRLAGDRNDP